MRVIFKNAERPFAVSKLSRELLGARRPQLVFVFDIYELEWNSKPLSVVCLLA